MATAEPSGWSTTAKWREHLPFPDPGAVITVHWKDGSSSEHTVSELRSRRYDRAANLRITLDVE